ncbi:MAG: hypothetical protein U0Z44_12115 [Kouleothrix sp.]
MQSQMLQQLAQGRNELRLLTNQLAQRNQALMHANTELRRLDDVKSNQGGSGPRAVQPAQSILGYLELAASLENDLRPAYGRAGRDAPGGAEECAAPAHDRVSDLLDLRGS